MNQTFMKEKSICPLLLSMSLPMVLSMLVNSLYNIVDSFFVAQISENAMTALSLVFPIQNLINALCIGFGVGINAAIAIHLGAKRQKEANDCASHGWILSFVQGVILSILSILSISSFLRMFTANQEILSMGFQYALIVFSFAPVLALELTYEKVYQAVGKMTVSMFAMTIGCLSNIILDPLFIFGLDLGIQGAAIATGFGQLISLIIYFVIYKRKPLNVKFEFKHFHFQSQVAKELYTVGIPATLNLALPSLLVSSLNSILAPFSPSYVVVLGIYYKLQTFLYLPASGIVQGMRPILGYNYGAKEYHRVKKIYHFALILNGSIMLVGTLICLFFPAQLMSLFTNNAQTIQNGTVALRIICLGFMISTISITASGALEGLGKGFPSFLISLLRYALLIIPIAFLLSKIFQAEGVWHAFWIAECITGILAFFIYRKSTKIVYQKEPVLEPVQQSI